MTQFLKFIIFFSVLWVYTLPVTAAPDAELHNSHWLSNNKGNDEKIDHSTLSNLLQTYRYQGDDGIARFAYDKVTLTDQQKLTRYIAGLQRVTVTALDLDSQFAFWVNLYNSLTLKVVLDHFPINTVRDINISPGFFSVGPWGAKLITIEGYDLSLDDIEHGILRPIWTDPRIHYVVNCASLGCPDIPARALDPTRLEDTLNQAATTFINHPRAVKADGDQIITSSIYHWFSDDFGESDRKILRHLAKYAKDPLKSRLLQTDQISDHSYAWQLNQ